MDYYRGAECLIDACHQASDEELVAATLLTAWAQLPRATPASPAEAALR
jgi:hypothetical protein